MGKHAQIVIGPAGSGKSTYCHALQQHTSTILKRTVHIVNLDPAAEYYEYQPVADIRDLISLQDVQEELQLGPNGGLLYCMEYLSEHLDWLNDVLNGSGDPDAAHHDYGDDYLVFDCPGQIELYSHLPAMKRIISYLSNTLGYTLCVVSMLDSLLVTDAQRFVAGTLMSLSFMAALELPHVNVLTKCDLIDEKLVDQYLDPDMEVLLGQLTDNSKVILSGSASNNNNNNNNTPTVITNNPRYHRLNTAIASLIERYSLVSYISLNLQDDESINVLLQHIDNALQYGEDVEPHEPEDERVDEESMFPTG